MGIGVLPSKVSELSEASCVAHTMTVMTKKARSIMINGIKRIRGVAAIITIPAIRIIFQKEAIKMGLAI